MQLISSTIPLAALITGSVLLLLVAGTAVVSRRRGSTAPPTGPSSVPTPPRELTPVG
jgi:hypothetical protein